MLSLCHTPESQYLLERDLHTCLLHQFFAAAAQGIPLDHLALGAMRTCIAGCMELKQMETVICCLPTPRYCVDNRLKYTTSLNVKEAYLLILELWPEGQASGLAYI